MLSEDAREKIMDRIIVYVFAVQQMCSIEEDNAYTTNVVTGLFHPNNGKSIRYVECT